MSLNRLMLRLAVVNALTKQDNEEFAPTIAGDMVFDTRLDDIEFDEEGLKELPIIQVYTDSDENVSYSTADGGMEGYRHVLLRIIFAVGSFDTSIVDAQRRITYGLPTTDAQLEAMLDILEWQIIRTFQNPFRKASTVLSQFILNWESFHSEPSRSADKNNRLAERTLTCRVRIPQDCPPVWHLEGQVPPQNPDLPVFPDAPYLNALVEVLAMDENNQGLISDLKELVSGTGRIVIPRFKRTSVNIDAIDPADPNLLKLQQRTSGPDGRIEVQAEWTLP